MKNTLFIFLVCLTLQGKAQKQTNNWYFGHNAAITFNTDPPQYIPDGQIYTNEGTSSISDTAGNLLFYSEGDNVWDRSHTLMPNGTGLYGGISSTQSCIIVPKPGSATLYYLFTTPQMELGFGTPMTYSIMDLDLHDGFGDLVIKNAPLLEPSTEKLTAVQHGNGVDFWIIAHKWESADFYAFKLSSAGLDTVPVISTSGSVQEGDHLNAAGYLKASPCGDKLAQAVYIDNYIELFDFNDMTGIVSHAMHLADFTDDDGVYGIEFSPDCSKLYANINDGFTVQFNLLAGDVSDIKASQDTIAESPVNFGALQLGPDGKIYSVRVEGNTLDCITNPDASADSINYIPDYILLDPSSAYVGLPNFVTSFLKKKNSDTTNTALPQFPGGEYSAVTISPNPVKDELSIHAPEKIYLVVLMDMNGHIQLQIDMPAPSSDFAADVSKLKPGLYIVKVYLKDRSVSRKILIADQ